MLKIQIAISSDLCIRLTWNLTDSCGQQQGLRGWSRMMVKQFQDGGRPPFWKSIYRHISVKNHPIFMKCCRQQQILNWMNVTWSKMKQLHRTDSEFDRTYFLFTRKIDENGNSWAIQCISYLFTVQSRKSTHLLAHYFRVLVTWQLRNKIKR